MEKKVTKEEFLEEFKKLCDRTGFNLVAYPTFVSTNHGTFEIKINVEVGEMPKMTPNSS